MKFMNNTKKFNRTINRNKNKLNNKIILIFYLYAKEVKSTLGVTRLNSPKKLCHK